MPNLSIPNDPEWQWVYDLILYTVGEEFPEADPAALRAMAQELQTTGGLVLSHIDAAASLSRDLQSSLEGPAAEAFAGFAANITNGLPVGGDIANALAFSADEFALDSEATQYGIVIAAFTIVVEIAIALATGFGAAAVPGLIKIGQQITRQMLDLFKDRLQNLLLRTGLEALEEAAQEMAETIAAQAIQFIEGNRRTADGQDILMSGAGGAFIGGGVAGVFGLIQKYFPNINRQLFSREAIMAGLETVFEGLFTLMVHGNFNPFATAISSMAGGYASARAHQWSDLKVAEALGNPPPERGRGNVPPSTGAANIPPAGVASQPSTTSGGSSGSTTDSTPTTSSTTPATGDTQTTSGSTAATGGTASTVTSGTGSTSGNGTTADGTARVTSTDAPVTTAPRPGTDTSSFFTGAPSAGTPVVPSSGNAGSPAAAPAIGSPSPAPGTSGSSTPATGGSTAPTAGGSTAPTASGPTSTDAPVAAAPPRGNDSTPASTTPSAPAAGSPAPAASTSGSDVPAGNTSATPPPASAGVAGSTGLTTDLSSPTARPEGLAGFDSPTSTTTGASTTSAGLDAPASPVSGTNAPSTAPATVGASNTSTSGGTGPSSTASSGTTSGSTASSGTTSGSTASSGTTSGSTASSGTGPSSTASSGTTSSTSTSSSAGARNSAETGSASGRSDLTTPAQALPPENLTVATDLPAPPAASAPPASPVPVEIGLPGLESLGIPAAAPAPTPAPASPSPVPAPAVRKTPDQVAASSPTRTVQVGRHRVLVRSQPGRWREQFVLVSESEWAQIANRPLLPDGDHIAHTALIVHGGADNTITVPVELPDGFHGTAQLTPAETATLLAQLAPATQTWVLAACASGDIDGGFAQQTADAAAVDILAPAGAIAVGADVPGNIATEHGTSWQLHVPAATGTAGWDVINDHSPFDGIKAIRDKSGSGLRMAPERPTGPRSPRPLPPASATAPRAARPATPEEQPVEDTSAGRPETVNPLPTAPEPVDGDSASVTLSLTNLHLLLEHRPSWAPGWAVEFRGQRLRRAATAFGRHFAADLAGRLTGRPVAPGNVTDFLSIESVAAVQGLANLIFLQAAAAAEETFEPLPMRSLRPIAEVVDLLDPVPQGFDPAAPDALTLRGAGAFLRANEAVFREQLARQLSEHLDRSVDAAHLVLDPPVPDGPAGGRSAPAAIEVELLRGTPQRTPLGLADAELLFRVAEQHGTESRRARELSGRSPGDLRDRHRLLEKGGADARSAPQRFGHFESPRRLPNGVLAYLPDGDEVARAFEVLDLAEQLPSSPGTLTVTGIARGAGSEVAITDGTGGIIPDLLVAEPFVANAAQGGREHPVLVLRLLDNRQAAETIARQTQSLIDRDTLLGGTGPRGVVVGVPDPTTGRWSWQAAIPGSERLQPTGSLDDALTVVRGLPPLRLDPAQELRARVDGHTAHPSLTTAECAQLALQDAGDLPSYSERATDSPDSFAETELRVPVRPGATPGEAVDTARLWLDPEAVQEVVSRGDDRATQLVRIGPSLRAHVLRLPATGTEPDSWASVVRPAESTDRVRYRVWVNRHQPLPGHGGPVSMTAVLPDPHVDWSVLDTLPPSFLSRLTIEPGRVDGNTIDVGEGRPIDAAEYAGRLADTDEPVVVLQAPMHSDAGLPFVRSLSHAGWVLAQRVQDGRREWLMFRDGELVQVIPSPTGRELGEVLRNSSGGPIVTPGQAVHDLLRDAVRTPDAPAALVVRRAMAAAELSDTDSVRGWLTLPPGSRPPGPISTLLRHYPAGLAPLRAERVSGMVNIPLQVPSRYAAEVTAGGLRQPVADLTALAEARAVVGVDGRVTVPPAVTSRRGVEVMRGHLAGMRAQRPADQPDQRVARLFGMLGHVPRGAGPPSLTAWADQLGAQFREVGPQAVERLGAGAVTLARTRAAGVLIAVGVEDPHRPALLTLGGEPVDPAVLGQDGLQLLLDGDGRMAQIDITVPDMTLPAVRGRPGEDATVSLTDQVADRLRAYGDEVPADLEDRLNRRVSVTAARRLSRLGGHPAVLDVVAQEAVREVDEPVDEEARRTELLSGVVEVLTDNGVTMSVEDVQTHLDVVLAAEPPEWIGSSVPEQMIIRVGLNIAARQAEISMMAAGGVVSRERRARFRAAAEPAPQAEATVPPKTAPPTEIPAQSPSARPLRRKRQLPAAPHASAVDSTPAGHPAQRHAAEQMPTPAAAAELAPSATVPAGAVPADGNCQLYSLIGADPERVHRALTANGLGSAAVHDWLTDPVRVRSDLQRHAQVLSDTAPVPIDSPLAQATDALRDLVVRRLDSYEDRPGDLPIWVVQEYRTAGDGFGPDQLPEGRDELLTQLSENGITTVTNGQMLPVTWLRDRFIERRAAELTSPDLSPTEARRAAEREVPLVDSRPDATPELADDALSMQQMLTYLTTKDGALPAAEAPTSALRDMLSDHYLFNGRPVTRDELATVRHAAANWQNFWLNNVGDTFLPLLAHTLDLRVTVLRGDQHDSTSVGEAHHPQVQLTLEYLHYSYVPPTGATVPQQPAAEQPLAAASRVRGPRPARRTPAGPRPSGQRPASQRLRDVAGLARTEPERDLDESGLNTVVDEIVHQVRGHDDTGDWSLNECVVLSQAFLRRVHPAVAVAAASDDTATNQGGSAGVRARLVAGPGWAQNPDRDRIRELVDDLGDGATVLWAESRQNGADGHVRMWHRADNVVWGIDPQRDGGRVYPVVHPTLDVRAGIAETWVLVIDADGHVATPGPESGHTASALVDAPTNHAYGAHAEEVEVHNLGLFHSGTTLPGKVVVARSNDGLVEVATDFTVLQVGTDDRLAEPRAGGPQRTMTLSIPEINTTPSANLPQEDHRPDHDEVQERVRRTIVLLSNASPMLRLTDQTTSLRSLLPAGEYTIPSEYANVTVARLPEIRPNFPLYVQYTEDVPIAGMYQFLDHVARYARPTGGAEQGLRAAMRFGRQVAALFVERTVQRRPSEGDMEMLLASQPVMSLMGVMAVSAHVVAGGLDHAIIRQGIMRGRLLVAPRHSLQVLWQALGGEIQTFLRQNAAEIRQMFVGNVDWLRRTYNHVYRLHPNTAVNLLGIWMVQDHTLTPTHTAFDVLNQVLDPPANSAGIPSSVFRIGPSHNNGLLNLRPPAPPTAALELRYYGVRPVDGPEIYSSQPMYVSDSGQIRQAARHADTNATMAHRLGATREGRAVTTALVHAIAAEPSDRVQRINALVNAIVVYGHLYPHHESALRTLLAPAEQRLSVQLVPLTGPAAPGGQHHGQFGPAAPLLPSSQGWPPQNFFPPQAQISGPAASSAPDGENPPAPADDLDGTPAGPVPGTLWNAPVEFSTHGITAAVQRPDGSATSVDEDWDDWEKEAAALRAARVPTQVINWARQQAWSATTDEAMRWFRPDEERRRLNVVVEIELPAVDPNESAAGRAAREETEERFSWWATGVVNRQLNLGLSRWGDRAGTAAPQAEVRYAVVRTPRTDARPAPDRLRLRFDGQETMPESPPQSLRQRELILDGAMVLADRNPQTLELTAEARSKVARFTVEVAARAVERHFAGAPGPLVHLVGQFDETGGGDTDDAENDVDEAYEPFRGFLEASVADQLAERLRRDPTTDEVRAVVRTLIVSRSTKPAKNADLARRFAMPVELHLVAPALAPPPLDGEDVRSSDWRSPEPAPTLENPLSSAEVERIAAALPDSAFVLVHLENADVTEPPGDGRTLLRSYRAEGRHDLARVHVEGRGWIRIFRHRIHLAEEQGVSPGVVQQFQEDLTASLQEDVNARFRLPGGDQFHLMVEFVEPERAHLTATVGSTPEGGADTKPVDTEYWPEWLVRRDAGFRRAVLTHEIWHNAFAAPDEYRDAAANGRRSIFRSDAPGARDRRLPRLYELEEGLMGPSRWSPDMIRARYLTRIDFAQRSQVNAPETTVRLTGDTVEVVPQSVLELRRIAERGPAVTNAQLAAEWRYGHALEGMLDDAETNQVYGRTYAVLPRHDADRYLIGDQFLLLTSSRPPENVPAGHRLLVFDSSHLVVHSEGRELRFVPVYSADHDRETDDGTAYLTGPAPAAETSANPAEVPNDSAELPNEPEFDEPPATARDDARLDEAAAWLESPSGYIEDGYPAVPVPHAGRQNPARAADTHKAFINGLDRAISLRRTRTTNNASLPVETLPPPAKEPLATAGGRPFASSALPALVAEVRRSTAQSEDPQLCLVQADAVRSRLFPGGVRLPRAVTDVDAVRLVDANFTEANGWPRVPGFGPVVEGVRAAGVGSAAFVVLERPDGVGHAWVVVHTEDGRIVAVDVDAPAEHDRVTELPADPDQFRAQRVGPLESAVSTRVQLVGPTGAVIDGAFPTVTESQSAARALVDRTPDSRYGALRRGPARSSGRPDAADQRQRDAAVLSLADAALSERNLQPPARLRLNLEFRNLLNKIAQENPDAFLDNAGKLLREAVSPDGTVRIQPSELRPLITLSPDLIDKLAEQPAALPLVLRDPAVFETLMKDFPSTLDAFLALAPGHVDEYLRNPNLLQRLLSGDRVLLKYFESNRIELRRNLFPQQLIPLIHLGPAFGLAIDSPPPGDLGMLLSRSPLGEVIAGDPSRGPRFFKQLSRSYALTEGIVRLIRVSDAGGRAPWAANAQPWDAARFRYLLDNPRIFELSQRYPAAVPAMVAVPGVLEAIVADERFAERLDQGTLAELLAENPAFGKRLTDLGLLGAAADNPAVAALLSLDITHFDSASDENLARLLRDATAPAQPPAGPGETDAARALRNHPALAALVKAESTQGNFRTLKYLMTSSGLAKFFADHPRLLDHPHEYRWLSPYSQHLPLMSGVTTEEIRAVLPSMIRGFSWSRNDFAAWGASGPATQAAGQATVSPRVRLIAADPARREALTRSGALRRMLAEAHHEAALFTETPHLFERIRRDDRIATVYFSGQIEMIDLLKSSQEFVDLLFANDGALRRAVFDHRSLNTYLSISPPEDLPLEQLARQWANVELLLTPSDPGLAREQWDVVIRNSALLAYLGSRAELRSLLAENRVLLRDIANRFLPDTEGEFADWLDEATRTSATLHRTGNKDWFFPLARAIGRRPARLRTGNIEINDDPRHLGLLTEDGDAADLAEQIASSENLVGVERANRIAALQDLRRKVLGNDDLRFPARYDVFASALIKAPALADALLTQPGLLKMARTPAFAAWLHRAPGFFVAMREDYSLFAEFRDDESMRFMLSSPLHAPILDKNPAWLFVRNNHPVVHRFMLDRKPAASLLGESPSVAAAILAHDWRVWEEVFSKQSFVEALARQPEPVRAAALSALPLMRLLAENPAMVDALAAAPEVAEALRSTTQVLTTDEYRAVLTDPLLGQLSRHPGLAGLLLSQVELLRTAIAVDRLVPALATAPQLADVLSRSPQLRELVMEQPEVADHVGTPGGAWLPLLRGWPALVDFLRADPAHTALLHRSPELLSALSRNRRVLAVLQDETVRPLLADNPELIGAIDSYGLNQLRHRGAAFAGLAGPVRTLDRTAWSAVLHDPRLLARLEASQELRQVFFADPAMVRLYLDHPSDFTDTVSRLDQPGSQISATALAAKLSETTASTEASGQPQRPAASALPGPAPAAEPAETPVAETSTPAQPVAAPVDALTARFERDEASRELLQAVISNPALRAAFAADPELPWLLLERPDLIDTFGDDGNAVDNHRFRHYLDNTGQGHLEYGFESAFYTWLAGIGLQVEAAGALKRAARITWDQARHDLTKSRQQTAIDVHERFRRLKPNDPGTWVIDDRILFARGVDPTDLTDAEIEVLKRAASGQGIREEGYGINRPAHTHGAGHGQGRAKGFSMTWVVREDGRVALKVYSVSRNRSGNNYMWVGAGSKYVAGPLPIEAIATDPDYTESVRLLRERPHPGVVAEASSAQGEPPRDPESQSRSRLLLVHDSRVSGTTGENSEMAAQPTKKKRGKKKKKANQPPKTDEVPSAQAFSVVTSPMDRARLRDVADGIVTEAPGDDPNACLNRLLVFRDQVFRAIRHQNTSDDSVLGGGRSHPFGMASAWPRVDGLRSIVTAMRDLPAGSAAFVLLDNQDRDKGHAVLLYNVADPATDGSPPRVRTVLVDLNPVRAGQHVTDLDETSDPLDEFLTDRIKPATVTRALVVDNTGTVRDVIPTTAPSTSQAQALADPPTNLGYAGSGIEADFTEIMWLTGISDPKRVWVTRSGSMLHAPHTGYNATGYPLPPMPQPDPDWENHT